MPSANENINDLIKLEVFLVTWFLYCVFDLMFFKYFAENKWELALKEMLKPDQHVENPKLLPLVVYTIVYACGIVFFSTFPSLHKRDSLYALRSGFYLGAFAWATHSLPDQTWMKGWTDWLSVRTILIEGVITAFTSSLASFLTLKFKPKAFLPLEQSTGYQSTA